MIVSIFFHSRSLFALVPYAIPSSLGDKLDLIIASRDYDSHVLDRASSWCCERRYSLPSDLARRGLSLSPGADVTRATGRKGDRERERDREIKKSTRILLPSGREIPGEEGEIDNCGDDTLSEGNHFLPACSRLSLVMLIRRIEWMRRSRATGNPHDFLWQADD